MNDAITYRLYGQRSCYNTLAAAPECLLPRKPEKDFRWVTAQGVNPRWTLYIAAIDRRFRLRGAAATELPEGQDP